MCNDLSTGFFFLMLRRPPRSTRTDTLFPYTPLFRSGSIKHDVSVPVSRVPEFIRAANAAVEALIPGCRPCPFGHIGDGNIHYNASQPVGADTKASLARWAAMNGVVHAIVFALNVSISADDGVGPLKTEGRTHYTHMH